MNIAFIYSSPFNPQVGGIERVTDVLSRELIKRGHKIFYIHQQEPEKYQDYVPPAEVFFLDASNFDLQAYQNFLREKAISVVINQLGLFLSTVLYSQVNAQHRRAPVFISVCHNEPLINYNNLFSLTFSQRNNTWVEYLKIVAKFLTYPFRKWKYYKNRSLSMQASITHSDLLVILSNNVRDDLKKLCGKYYESTKVVDIPNPLPPQLTNFTDSSKKNWLLFVGRLEYTQKRPDRLLKIWKLIYHQFQDWELHIVGDGPYRAQLEKEAHRLPRIYFEGQQDPTQFYEQSKILLLTSNCEGFPMVLPEAMYYGLVPVLFNSFHAAVDIVDDGINGILVSPYEIKNYAYKLSQLMRAETRREEMSAKAREKVKLFDVARIVDKYESIFYQLCQAKNHRC